MTRRSIGPVIIGSAISALLFTSASALAQTPPRLSLKDAEQRALAGHPDIAGAQAAAQAVQQSVREAKSAYWPSIFGNVTGAAASPEGTRITAGALNNHGYVVPSEDLVFVRLGNGKKFPKDFEDQLVMKVLAGVNP